MADLVEAGSAYPTRMTLAIATVLFLWSAMALSGAGVIPRIPHLRLALPLIGTAYRLRLAFWLWSGASAPLSEPFTSLVSSKHGRNCEPAF